MKVAFIHSGALGDLILSLPMLQTLRREEAESIDLFAISERARFLAGRSVVNQGRSLESAPLAVLFTEKLDADAIPPVVKETFGQYEDIINGLAGDQFARNLKKATGKAHVRNLEVRASTLEHGQCHASEYLHRQMFGILSQTPLPKVTPTDADKAWAADILGAADGARTVIIHPGSGGKDGHKSWPLDNFLAVADRLAADGWHVRFVLGEVEAEWMSQEDRDRLAERFGTLTDLTLEQLAGVVASADAYLGNDSGPTHLAAACGTPTVALFGPTNPEVWAPRGPAVTVLTGDATTGPDWNLTPDAVVEAVAASTPVA